MRHESVSKTDATLTAKHQQCASKGTRKKKNISDEEVSKAVRFVRVSIEEVRDFFDFTSLGFVIGPRNSPQIYHQTPLWRDNLLNGLNSFDVMVNFTFKVSHPKSPQTLWSSVLNTLY